jgi:hypothetical protein
MAHNGLQGASLLSQDPLLGEKTNSNRAAMQRYPLLIGISGKRIFEEDIQIDRAIADDLADRFRKLFAGLDQEFPETPKIILTGAAFGTDLIAAETALQIGSNWAVAAILPFDRVLFAEDFESSLDKKRGDRWRDRYLEHAHTFERLLNSSNVPNPRVLVREMPILSVETDGIAANDRLSRKAPTYDKAYRHNHYEQVGQYIAEVSTILIAVMSGDEQPERSDANGGTARVVAYRRAGCPDAAGFAVARRSKILRREWPEVKPLPAAYVWLMDPKKHDRTGRYPVKVVPPLSDRLVDEIYAGHPGRDVAQELESYVGPLRKLTTALRGMAARPVSLDDFTIAELRWLRASLPVARGFNRYNKAKLRETGSENAAVTVDLSPVASIPEALELERAHVSLRQRKVNDHAKAIFRSLAQLFVVAVFIYEIFAKFFHDNGGVLAIYLLILAAIVGVALFERWKLSEAVAEDYRAVAEMLRVQHAWYSAGLTARVDWEHLQGVDQDLAPVRECAKTIIAWIFLRLGLNDDVPKRDWAHVRGTSVEPRDLRGEKKPPKDWIGSQLWYFTKNGKDREARAARADAETWCMFAASGVLGGLLWTWLTFDNAMSFFVHMAHFPFPEWANALGFDVSLLVWAGLAAATIQVRGSNHDFRQGSKALLLTGVLGAIAAVFIALAFVSAGPLIIRLIQMLQRVLGLSAEIPDFRLAVINAVISGLALLYAAAGAKRYLTERLNIEAEALEYRDARRRFERAERLLARGSHPASGAPADEEAAQRLVYELGCLALAENEAWLKSRRERPLTPVVG